MARFSGTSAVLCSRIRLGVDYREGGRGGSRDRVKRVPLHPVDCFKHGGAFLHGVFYVRKGVQVPTLENSVMDVHVHVAEEATRT